VGTTIFATIPGLVTVTDLGSSATVGTKTFLFATKVSPSAGLYQFRALGMTAARANTSDAPTVQVNVNYNPPILTATQLGSSTAAGAKEKKRILNNILNNNGNLEVDYLFCYSNDGV
jgi:hypothetical protein